MQFNPLQKIYQAVCSDTGEVLCAFDASSFDEAQVRVVIILSSDAGVPMPPGNVRILLLPPDQAQAAPHYFPHAFFVLQSLRRDDQIH